MCVCVCVCVFADGGGGGGGREVLSSAGPEARGRCFAPSRSFFTDNDTKLIPFPGFCQQSLD